MHCATGRGRLQSWANKDETFPSLCTRLQGLPNGMGDLYKTLVSSRFGPGYIKTPHFQDQLAVCHAHNKQLTVALIENAEGAQVILETRNGIPGSTFEAIENDIAWRSAAVQYSYLSALASHERDRAANQIKAVEEAGDEEVKQTFPNVRRQAARSEEAGTFFCGFPGCNKSYANLSSLKRHVKEQQIAKAPTHVGYTPDNDDFSAEIKARGGLTRPHGKKTWRDSPP
jgi:hypothetical protein